MPSLQLVKYFSDTEFSAPGNSFLWGLGALEELNRECAGFLIMPKRPYEWRVHSHGCYKFNNATRSVWDLETKLLIFLCSSSISVPPICLEIAASCVANKRNKEGLSADTTNTNVCGNDVNDRAPVHQGHVSVPSFTPVAVARESFACQLCLLTALTISLTFSYFLSYFLLLSLLLTLCHLTTRHRRTRNKGLTTRLGG